MQQRIAAVERADAATWDRLTADNCTLVAPDGTLMTKAQRLAQMRTQQPDTAVPAKQETVLMYGNAAIHRYEIRGNWVMLAWSKDRTGWRVTMAQVTPVATDSADVRRAIESTYTRYTAALRSGDAAAVAQMYTDNAIVMAPGFPAWQGRAGINAGFAGFFAQFAITDVRLATNDLIVSDGHVIEQGTYAWTLHPKTGNDITDNGKYLTVWERQADGSWKILRDMNNTDRPGPM
jgi:uncharacterized protein (TIGR02246 family)